MTPFHPLLRQALLRDKAHRSLTADLLNQYELLLARLYEFESEDAIVGEDKRELVNNIRTFRENFMPNFDQVRQNWAESQLKNIKGRYRDTGLSDALIRSLRIIGLWLLRLFVRPKPEPRLPGPVLRSQAPCNEKPERPPGPGQGDPGEPDEPDDQVD